MSKSIEKFYDEHATRQVNAGIHHRHLSIQRWLERFEMPKDGNILEVGCGIGTQTQLMLQYLSPKANLVSVDLSPKSIEIASSRLSEKYNNLTLIAGNIIELEFDLAFDVIVMPDVLEHIPIDQHEMLFQKFSEILSENGIIVIHMPDPDYLEWIKINKPHKLQIIDQPIHLNELLPKAYNNGFVLTYSNSYSVYTAPEDYILIVFKRKHKGEYDALSQPLNDKLLRKIKRKLKYLVRGS